MTTHQLPTTSTPSTTRPDRRGAPALGVRSILRRAWRVVLDVAHGIDAGSAVAHGRSVPPDHPARRRRLDHEEVADRLDQLYPRA